MGLAAAVGGIATSLGEYSRAFDDLWRGKNGKWYSLDWGGNQWTGARSNALEAAGRFRAATTGLFAVGTALSVLDGARAYSSGDGLGVARAAMDTGWGAAGTFGGPVGFAGAAGYTATSLLIRNPSVYSVTVTPIVDGLCYMSSGC